MDGTRTHNNQFGRLELYQLSYHCNFVHPEGLKPPTLTSVVWCSIQLSYGCICGGRWTRTIEPEGTVLQTVAIAAMRYPHCWAPGRIRTDDRLITNQLLYQLSYGSVVEDIGFEPMHHFHDDGLANRSINHSGNPPLRKRQDSNLQIVSDRRFSRPFDNHCPLFQ